MNRHTKAISMVIAMAVLVAMVDQILKWAVVRSLPLNSSRTLIPNVLDLTYRQNPYAAFSMLKSLSPAILLSITLVVLVVFSLLIWPYLRVRAGVIAGALVFGGALGNLIDRIRLQRVVDYVDMHVWPVFNLADACVVVGVGLLMLVILRADRAAHPEKLTG